MRVLVGGPVCGKPFQRAAERGFKCFRRATTLGARHAQTRCQRVYSRGELEVTNIKLRVTHLSVHQPSLAKLQILTLAAKLLVLCSTARPIHALAAYVFNLARYDEDWDVRDRARFLKGLLRSILQSSDAENDMDGQADDNQGDVGGVVLRREQIKMVLLAAKEAVSSETQQGTPQSSSLHASGRHTYCNATPQTSGASVNS